VKRQSRSDSDEKLLQRFVAAFESFDDMVDLDRRELPPKLQNGLDDSERAHPIWKPGAIVTDVEALKAAYKTIPARFPPLYEQLVLSYRWLEIDLRGFVALFPNPPEASLASLISKITADQLLLRVLFPLGLIPFGKASHDNYDPICFDTARRRADGDCPVVQIEHESVLCDDRIGDSWQRFESFRGLVESVIASAENKRA
jgi:hypothetical protein